MTKTVSSSLQFKTTERKLSRREYITIIIVSARIFVRSRVLLASAYYLHVTRNNVDWTAATLTYNSHDAVVSKLTGFFGYASTVCISSHRNSYGLLPINMSISPAATAASVGTYDFCF